MKAIENLYKLKPSAGSTFDVSKLKKKCYEALDDDLNSPILLSHLFEGVKFINSVTDGSEKIDESGLNSLKELFKTFAFEILGLKDETSTKYDEKLTGNLMKIIIDLRQAAKNNKDWQTSDKIRNELKNAGIIIKDLKGNDYDSFLLYNPIHLQSCPYRHYSPWWQPSYPYSVNDKY
jgi:cysteinyl-tRNA synthetase